MAGSEGDSDSARFGRLVRERRKARTLSQEALAAAAFANADRKGYVSQIENGKIPNITRDTVRSIALALDIDSEEIPEALRWPEATQVARDTNTVVQKVETTVEATHARVSELQATVDKLVASEEDRARELGIKEGMLIALARRYAEGSPGDFDAALFGLERALEVARDEHEKGQLPSSVSDAMDAVIARIDALNEAGDFDAAQEALDEEFAQQKVGMARLCEKGIAQAILSRSVENAVRFTLAKIDLDAAGAHPFRWSAIRAAQNYWYESGRDRGLNFDLEVAVNLARHMLTSSVDSEQRGIANNNLGTALQALGERDRDTARLKAAIAAYRAALKERSGKGVPLDWAKTQNNLGHALKTLGERETGKVGLEAAVMAYHAALEQINRQHTPFEWATVQMNLGNALQTLGQRKSDTDLLDGAVTAHRAALEELPRERVPLDWARAQNNLGNALLALGERESGTTRFIGAVAAYRAALEEWTRESVPLEWARAQLNLGAALANLGERENGTARLEEAFHAYSAALEEWARDTVPLDWAMVQYNLAELENAFCEKAEAAKDASGAQRHNVRACRHIEAALEVLTPRTQQNFYETAVALRDRLLVASRRVGLP